MFKINRKVEYALIALKHLSSAGSDKLISAKEICDAYKTPFDPTSRVLQIMTQHGILKAAYGAHGGYQIIKDLSTITFQELSEMIVGPIQIANCFNHTYTHCELAADCNLIAPMLNLNERMSKLFATTYVSELIESRHQQEQNIKSQHAGNTAAE